VLLEVVGTDAQCCRRLSCRVGEAGYGGARAAGAFSAHRSRPLISEKAFSVRGTGLGVAQHGAHGFYFFVPEPPADGAASRAADDPDLRALIRVFMANRGVWESGWWLGPTVSVAHTAEDVDRYVDLFEEFLTEVT
jgi:hypothetical protein